MAVIARSIRAGAVSARSMISEATVTFWKTIWSARRLPVLWWNRIPFVRSSRRSLVLGLAEITATGTRST